MSTRPAARQYARLPIQSVSRPTIRNWTLLAYRLRATG
jgi:hypothetical protein